MKRMILAAAAALLSTAAFAADFPVKTPVAVIGNGCTPTSCSGIYVGGGIAGNGTNANIIGNGINNSVFAGGVLPSFDAGYQYAAGNWFFAGEFDAAAQLSSQVASMVGGSQNGALLMEIVKVGGNLNGLLGTQIPITIPAKLASALISPYVFVGAAQHSLGKLPNSGAWATGTASGAGATFDINQNWFVDVRYTNIQYGASQNGSLGFDSQNLIGVSFNYKFNR